MSITDGQSDGVENLKFEDTHAPLPEALQAMNLAERLPLGIAKDRRSAPRSLAGQLFLEEIGAEERKARVAQSTNPLDHPSRAYRIVEVIAVGGVTIQENVLGEMWLSVRDSDLAGLLPMARHLHVRVRLDRLDSDGPLSCGEELVRFIEDRAEVADADGLIFSTVDERLVSNLSQRGYLVSGSDQIGEPEAQDTNAHRFEDAIEEFAKKRGFTEAEVGLTGAPRRKRVAYTANRTLR